MDRPTYKKLLKAVQWQIENQKKDGCVSITPGFFTSAVAGTRLHEKDVEKAWPSIVKALGLVDDGTGALGKAMGLSGRTTWTVPGFGYLGAKPTNPLQEAIQVAADNLAAAEMLRGIVVAGRVVGEACREFQPDGAKVCGLCEAGYSEHLGGDEKCPDYSGNTYVRAPEKCYVCGFEEDRHGEPSVQAIDGGRKP